MDTVFPHLTKEEKEESLQVQAALCCLNHCKYDKTLLVNQFSINVDHYEHDIYVCVSLHVCLHLHRAAESENVVVS